MRMFSWVIRIFIFVVFFMFALKNTQEAVLRFFFDLEIRSPLVLLLLAFFMTGILLGWLSATPALFRQRREIKKAHKALKQVQPAKEATQAPITSVVNAAASHSSARDGMIS